jgi:hypothetical protein
MAKSDGKEKKKASRPTAEPAPPSIAPMDVTWDDDTVPRLDFDDTSFDRVTTIPEEPSELLAKKMMIDTPPPPGEADPVSGLFDRGIPKAPVPVLAGPSGAMSPIPFELEGALHAPSGGAAAFKGPQQAPFSTEDLPTAPPPRVQRDDFTLEIDESALHSARGQRPRQDPDALVAGPKSLELDLSSLNVSAPPPSSDPGLRQIADRYATGDFSGALVLAEAMLEAAPEHAEALRYAGKCRDVLMQMYAARLGPLDQLVSMSIPSEQIRWLSLDHRSGFLLSLIDGTSSIEELLDISGMQRLDALRIMYSLFQERVVTLTPRNQ